MPRPAPSALELRRDDLIDLAAGPLQAARYLTQMLGAERRAELGRALRGVYDLGRERHRSGVGDPAQSPRSVRIAASNIFAQDLARVKAVKDKLGGTLNDVVLATVAGGVRRFLKRRRVDVGAPRLSGDDAGERAFGRGARGAGQPRLRLDPSAARSRRPIPSSVSPRSARRRARLKESNQALGADLLSAVTEWTGTTLLSLGTRLQTIGRPHNLIVTNVPGSQVPLFLLGAPLHEAYPIGPLFQNQAVIVALFSYTGRLFWGLNADAALLPDLADLRRDLEASFEELASAAGTPSVD